MEADRRPAVHALVAERKGRGQPDVAAMAEPQRRSHTSRFHWRFDRPAAAIWPLLADTVRFNEAAGLPRYEVIETPQSDGTVRFEGRLKQGPLAIASTSPRRRAAAAPSTTPSP
jgi:hypothetical protein